jgi:hypothetical protein
VKLKFLIAAVLFISFFALGTFLSFHKPLWNDEIHTAKEGIQKLSYLEILQGKLTGEANNFPLYYLYQKSFMDVLHYKLSQPWEGEHFLHDEKGQVILRIPSNLIIALSLTILFMFFLNSGNLFSAVISLLLTLSSYMTWAYWPEARPYALWYGLSLLHGLLLLVVFHKDTPKNIAALTIIHWLLGLTSFVSITQILLANILLFWKRRSIRQFLILSSPLPVMFFYTSIGLSIAPRLTISIFPLITTTVPLEWMLILTATAFLALEHKKKIETSVLFFRVFFFGIFCSMLGIILLALIKNPPPPAPVLYYRHFIFVTPYAILATTHALKYLWDFYWPSKWAAINIGLFIFGAVASVAGQTALLLYEQITFIF